MKSLSVILIIFSQLFATIGFSMDVSICKNTITYSFYESSPVKACKCAGKAGCCNKCCKHSKYIVKADDSAKVSSKLIEILFKVDTKGFAGFYVVNTVFSYNIIQVASPLAVASKYRCSLDNNILNCVFRI